MVPLQIEGSEMHYEDTYQFVLSDVYACNNTNSLYVYTTQTDTYQSHNLVLYFWKRRDKSLIMSSHP